eukprot:jgi/Mesen1/10316/ME000079S09740
MASQSDLAKDSVFNVLAASYLTPCRCLKASGRDVQGGMQCNMWHAAKVPVISHPWAGMGGVQSDLVNQVLGEQEEHHRHIIQILQRVQNEDGPGLHNARADDSAAVLVHHASILRNKRCLLAYVYARADRIRGLRWQLGAVLPEHLHEHLSLPEREMFKAYSAALGEYMADIGTDLTVDVAPPKDPYIEVRVLEDTGALLVDDKVTYLEPNSVHLVQRSQVEPLILQGLVEQRES